MLYDDIRDLSPALRGRFNLILHEEIILSFPEGQQGRRRIQCKHPVLDAGDIQYQIGEGTLYQGSDCQSLYELGKHYKDSRGERTAKFNRDPRLPEDRTAQRSGWWDTAETLEEAKQKICEDWNSRQLDSDTEQQLRFYEQEEQERQNIIKKQVGFSSSQSSLPAS